MFKLSSGRIKTVCEAAEQWQKELVDLTGRNRLRNYRDLQAGTLDLTPGNAGLDAGALDSLLEGRPVRLSELFPRPAQPNLFAANTPPGDPLAGGAALDDARRRLSRIRKNARGDFEEKGIDTLFAAIGLATWEVDAGVTPPKAPVVLVPLLVEATGQRESDFRISVSDEVHLNPVLDYILAKEHEVDAKSAGRRIEGATGDFPAFEQLLEDVERSWQEQRPELQFKIEHRVVVGIFRYASQAMVEDLKGNCERFARNDLVAALAGDAGATEVLAAKICDPRPDQPDLDPPGDEFLVLDADSSQHLAINRVLGGESLVIQGPPGTGKSQTIANLIATLMARGKRILFVAEKRAAIEAVTKRLGDVGLDDLVMDIHGGIKGKKEFAQSLKNSLAAVGAIPVGDGPLLWKNLEDQRRALLEHSGSLHRPREPWGLSIYELQSRHIGIPEDARTELLLSTEAARAITGDSLKQLKGEIGLWVKLGGHTLAKQHPEWSSSSITTSGEAREAFNLVRDLADKHLPAGRDALFRALDEVSLSRPETVEEWQQTVDFLSSVERTLADCRPDVYRLDHVALREALAPARRSRWARTSARLFSSAYRRAREDVRATVRQAPKLAEAEALELLEEVAGQVGEWARRLGGDKPRLPGEVGEVVEHVARLVAELDKLANVAGLGGLESRPHPALEEMLRRMASNRTAVANLPRIRELESKLRETGSVEVTERVGDDIPPERAAQAFEYAWLQRVIDDLEFEDPWLREFKGESHSEGVNRFIELDTEHISSTPKRVTRRVAEAATEVMNQYPEETRIVRIEANKKAKLKSVRQLFGEAPHVLSALRPCWTMSPVLVAEMIPADLDLFDVVIFDEASQIQPAEAVGSLARAPQAVVAGDDEQLPPTPFFGLVPNDDPNGATAGMESILAAAGANALRPAMLEWHYRSRDDRLIAFSNHHLYGRALRTFPGTLDVPPIEHCQVPSPSAPGANTASNPGEVERVVELVLEHGRERPDETLGVIAFGQHHANSIEDALDRRRREDPSLDDFFADTRTERFFIKNIERVQGDERDAIILSAGYCGRNADGSLALNFGALNQDGGHRRLNVAVTRARSRVTFVSSFSHHDIAPGRSKARGVELLRQYIEYVASGGKNLGGVAPSQPALNPFELSVKRGLESRGIFVTPQYGSFGYRIDFACAHPDKPGRMVLAIEADGSRIHKLRTVRERDRLRQEVLEDKGWRFHRIWSTEWFRNREGELDKAEEAWRQAVEASNRGGPDPGPPVASTPAPQPNPPPPRGPRPDLPTWYNRIADYSDHQLEELVRWIKSDTLLRTDQQLMDEMRKELRFQRIGPRMQERFTKAIVTARTGDTR